MVHGMNISCVIYIAASVLLARLECFIDHQFCSLSDQTKDFKISMFLFSLKNSTVVTMTVWIVGKTMFPSVATFQSYGLLFQRASTIIQLSILVV